MEELIKKLVVSIKKSKSFSELENSYVKDPKNTIIKISKDYGELAAKMLEEEFVKKFNFKVNENENDLAASLNLYFDNSERLIYSFKQEEWSEISYNYPHKNSLDFESIFGDYSLVEASLVDADGDEKYYLYVYYFPKFDKYVAINYTYSSYGDCITSLFYNVVPKKIEIIQYERIER